MRSRMIRTLGSATAIGAAAVLCTATAASATTLPAEDACAGVSAAPVTTAEPVSVVEVVAGMPQLSTFADVLERAELTESLSEADSVTVFAPTDAAFAEIPANVLGAVLDDPELLADVAGYHVAGEGDDLAGRDEQAEVCVEVAAANGSVVVIDTVLQPPASGTVPGSSMPGSSAPPSSTPAFDAEQQEVATAFETAVDSSLAYDEQAPFIEDAEALRETIERYPAAAEAVLGIAARVTSVEIDGDTAAIRYVLRFNGVDAPYGELPGTMARLDGAWVVPSDEYCAFQAQARNSCPD